VQEVNMAARGYEDTEIYKLAKKLAVEVHRMTLTELPKYEMYAEGDQIRRSSKSIVANFVEGYGRRRYPADHVRFLTYAISTCDETKAHLEMLHETDCLKPERFQYLPNIASWVECSTTIVRRPSKAQPKKTDPATCNL
jgi:four helix bundle protein